MATHDTKPLEFHTIHESLKYTGVLPCIFVRKTLSVSLQLCTRCIEIAFCPLRIHFRTCSMPFRVVFNPCSVVSCCRSSLGQGNVLLEESAAHLVTHRGSSDVVSTWWNSVSTYTGLETTSGVLIPARTMHSCQVHVHACNPNAPWWFAQSLLQHNAPSWGILAVTAYSLQALHMAFSR